MLGQHLTLNRGIWYCDIPDNETKDGSPIAFTLPEDERFTAAFTHYLLVSRQLLLRERRANNRPYAGHYRSALDLDPRARHDAPCLLLCHHPYI